LRVLLQPPLALGEICGKREKNLLDFFVNWKLECIEAAASILLAEKLLAITHLSNRHLCDKHLSNRLLDSRHLANRHLADRHLADKHLAERHLPGTKDKNKLVGQIMGLCLS
jgi:hypothetical protein